MTADRPYRRALSPEIAQEELRADASRQFDPAVVEAFLGALSGDASETLVGVARAQHRRVVEVAADEHHPDRQAVGHPARDAAAPGCR